MKSVGTPPVGSGSGTQTRPEDGELDYPVFPRKMESYAQPPLPDCDEFARAPRALAVLRELLRCVERTDTVKRIVDISDFDESQRELLNQVLGEGEVSIRISDSEEWLIQESVFVGIWRVRQPASGTDRIEIGSIPDVVFDRGLAGAAARLELPAEPDPDGTINARALLVELADRQANWEPGTGPQVINLTLLPHSQQDLEYLDSTLGQGRTLILSRGYGNCRITATGVSRIWWVQYYNSVDTLILDTLEVVDVPAAALAAREDLQDSAIRLREVLAAME